MTTEATGRPKMASISPQTAVIEGLRQQKFQWSTILGELIDNAFDAGANRVETLFDRKERTVKDDGGARPADGHAGRAVHGSACAGPRALAEA